MALPKFSQLLFRINNPGVINEATAKTPGGQVYHVNPNDKHDMNTKRGEASLDKNYAYFGDAEKHMKSQGYKVNRDDKKPKHASPDITMHVEMGDDSPSAYTVHANGKAAQDRALHKQTLHVGAAD